MCPAMWRRLVFPGQGERDCVRAGLSVDGIELQVIARIECQSDHYQRYSDELGEGKKYVFSNFPSGEPERARAKPTAAL